MSVDRPLIACPNVKDYIPEYPSNQNPMKKLINTSCCVLLFAAWSVAQDVPTRFAVFEDNVKPSMDVQFKEALKKLKMACEENKITSFGWTSVVFDDNSYHHLVPIKGMRDLDEKNMMADLEGKMGKEALSGIFRDLGKCVDAQSSSVVSFLPDLSYQASPAAEETFRDLLFWQALPEKEMEAESIAMEWKKLHESKNAPNGYAVYKVDLGREPGYVFVSWGKDEADHATKAMKNNETLGEEGNRLWSKTMLITKSYRSRRAWVLPEFSYMPDMTTAQK